MADEQIRLAIAAAVGIGPAFAMMWFSLRRFDYPLAPKALFDDRRVFFSFAVGIVFGVVASALTVLVSTSGLGVILPLLAVALFEESFKLVYLNRPGYRGRFDTTFYGVTLGVGSSAALAMASAFAFTPNPQSATAGFNPALSVALLVAFSASMALTLASTGALIGFGAAHEQVLRYFPRAFLVRASHLVILVFFFVGEDAGLAAASLAGSLVFAGIVYAYVYREILPETLPTDLRKSLRRWPGEAKKAKKPAKGSG